MFVYVCTFLMMCISVQQKVSLGGTTVTGSTTGHSGNLCKGLSSYGYHDVTFTMTLYLNGLNFGFEVHGKVRDVHPSGILLSRWLRCCGFMLQNGAWGVAGPWLLGSRLRDDVSHEIPPCCWGFVGFLFVCFSLKPIDNEILKTGKLVNFFRPEFCHQVYCGVELDDLGSSL